MTGTYDYNTDLFPGARAKGRGRKRGHKRGGRKGRRY